MIDESIIEKIFQALDRQIGVRGGIPFSIVVCGGTALAALGLIKRTTRDVDVLGEAVLENDTLSVKKIDDFPISFKEAAQVVGRDFRLSKYWIDTGPAFQLETGLPDGFEERLVAKSYGKYLTVYFISRVDQIYFKLFASLDRGGYHVDDLLMLKPSIDEMRNAALWVLTQDDTAEFKINLKGFLEQKGFNEISNGI